MKITLCGSARFEKEWIEANRVLTMHGHIVYSLAVLPSHAPRKAPNDLSQPHVHIDSKGQAHEWYNEEEKIMLDLAHLGKILNSDAIVVLDYPSLNFNPGAGETSEPYTGFSTKREIAWARMNRKLIVRASEHGYNLQRLASALVY
jgi:hypothetical protein